MAVAMFQFLRAQLPAVCNRCTYKWHCGDVVWKSTFLMARSWRLSNSFAELSVANHRATLGFSSKVWPHISAIRFSRCYLCNASFDHARSCLRASSSAFEKLWRAAATSAEFCNKKQTRFIHHNNADLTLQDSLPLLPSIQ